MKTKETIIKAITKMDINLLDVVLDKAVYMDVPKALFLKTLENQFNTLKKNGVKQFTDIKPGTCSSCYKGCKGYSFLTENKDCLDILLLEKENDIVDVFRCSELENEEVIEKENKLYFRFLEDEKANYNPSSILLSKQRVIDNALTELKTFNNTISDIQLIANWFYKYENFYNSIKPYEWFNYRFIDEFTSTFSAFSYIIDLVKFKDLALKAMLEFDSTEEGNEFAILDWLLTYEDNELCYSSGYITTDNWEQTNLILLDNSENEYKNIIIDVSDYNQSLRFAKIYYNLYYEYVDKYKPPLELYNIYNSFSIELSEFLSVRGIYPELLKKHNIKSKEKNSNMEITGKIKVLNETQEIGTNGFRKREVVVTTEEQYPQHILVEFIQDKCELLNGYSEGQDVKININLRGREWINPEGVAKYFNAIQGWRIENLSKVVASNLKRPNKKEPSSFIDEEDDRDLPF